MTTFDLAEVRDFAANLNSRLNRCDNGEGMGCANLDASLHHYAALCCEFRDGVRQWGQAVLSGRVAFDPQVEEIWLDEGGRLYSRSINLLAYGERAEGPCFALDGQAALRSALLGVQQLLTHWVTPGLAVGPAARHRRDLTPDAAVEVRQRIAALPPLLVGPTYILNRRGGPVADSMLHQEM